jgi:hypothetical protein
MWVIQNVLLRCFAIKIWFDQMRRLQVVVKKENFCHDEQHSKVWTSECSGKTQYSYTNQEAGT